MLIIISETFNTVTKINTESFLPGLESGLIYNSFGEEAGNNEGPWHNWRCRKGLGSVFSSRFGGEKMVHILVLLEAEFVSPWDSYIESLPPVPQNVTVFGDNFFKVSKVKWSDGRALGQYDWCSGKRRRLGHKQAQAQRKDCVSQREGERDECLQAKERGLRKNSPASTLVLNL